MIHFPDGVTNEADFFAVATDAFFAALCLFGHLLSGSAAPSPLGIRLRRPGSSGSR